MPSFPAAARTYTLSTAWLRDEASWTPVAAVVRTPHPYSIRLSSSRALCTLGSATGHG